MNEKFCNVKSSLILICLALLAFQVLIQNAMASDILSVQITPPSKTTIFIYTIVSFAAQASGGSDGYNYQWYANDTAIQNATSSTLAFNATQIGYYGIKCVATDATGLIPNPATSQTILLYVSARAVTPGVMNPRGSGNSSITGLDNLTLTTVIAITVVVVAAICTLAVVIMKRRRTKKTSNS